MSALEIALLISLISLLGLALLLFRAPSGYEDEEGFHFGKPDRQHRHHVGEFEPVARRITFAALVFCLCGVSLIALVVLVWQSGG